MLAETRVGPVVASDGAVNPARAGKTGEIAVVDAHGRYYEPNSRGAIFSGGMTTTSISNSTFTTGTLTASETPIAGLWNPTGSGKNLVVLQVTLGITVTAATATGPGPFVWAVSTGNAALTLGTTPLNRATLINAGSVAKDMCGIALTGLTNNMVVKFGSALFGGNLKNISSVETAVGQNIGASGASIENFDGLLIVPPGAVLSLLATTTPVAHSAASSIVWEEVSI